MSNTGFLSRQVRPWVRWMAVAGASFGLLTLLPAAAIFVYEWRWPDWAAAPLFPGLLVSFGLIHGDNGTQYEFVRDMIISAMVINTIAGAMLGAGLRGIVALVKWCRRRHLARRNKCMTCGYSLRGLAHRRCPECGANQDV